MLDKNPDHHHVDDVVVPKPAWRTPAVEAYEQEMNKQEHELSKTPEGRADQRKRGIK